RATHDPGRHGDVSLNPGDERALSDFRNRDGLQSAPAQGREGRAGTKKAPVCRVGRSNEPAKAGGAAVIGCASGFLKTEACTTRNLAALLGVALAQTSLRQASR